MSGSSGTASPDRGEEQERGARADAEHPARRAQEGAVREIEEDVQRPEPDERDAQPRDEVAIDAALDRGEHAHRERRERLEAVEVRGDRALADALELRLRAARLLVVVAARLLPHVVG